MENIFKKNINCFSMMEQEIKMSVFDVFASSQETFEEAKKKSSEESNKRVNYLRFPEDGTYTVRILPLAPVIDAEGQALPMDRKGYEYPLRSLMLKIEDTKSGNNGKPKLMYVNVCNAKYAFPQLKDDLIDMYVQTATSVYADDESLCKKLKSSSFEGGLKWDSKRCMYVLDYKKPQEGIQILQITYSQYKEIEERKLNLWNKLISKSHGAQVPCPISSIKQAYPLEITRKTENKKVNYSFNIETIGGADELEESTLQALLDAQRLPEVLYRYTRFHLEATIAFLKQQDEKYGINVMNEECIANCIEQIKMLLPADDQSHFKFGAHSEHESGESSSNNLDSLWARFDKIDNEGLDDKSAEGQELRTSIKEYIEDNGLDIKITRSKSNQDLLEEIEDIVNGEEKETEEDEEEVKSEKHAPRYSKTSADEEEEEEEEEPATQEDEEEEEEPATPSRERERNDDTNEPAARPSRRGARPTRRR